MSKKADVLGLYEAGKTRDEIHEETGISKRYIRVIVNESDKGDGDGGVEGEDPKQEGEEVVIDAMEFENDLKGESTMVGDKMADPKTGKEYHKAWVAEKAYECSCGCTLNRKSTYCPNCGTALNWEGF